MLERLIDFFRLQIPPKGRAKTLVSNEPYSPATKRTGILVLGLGNVLLGDDGLGAAAVARLEAEYSAPRTCNWQMAAHSGFRFSDCSPRRTTSSSLTRFRADGPPGTLVRLDGEDVGNAGAIVFRPTKLGLPICSTLHVPSTATPLSVTLLGLIPDTIDLGGGPIDPLVDDRLHELVAAIVHEVQSPWLPDGPRSRSCRPASF